jgi:hypothetical protein
VGRWVEGLSPSLLPPLPLGAGWASCVGARLAAWRQIGTLLEELDGIVRSGWALGYALADAGAQFQATLPGWQPWTGAGNYQVQTTRALDTMRASLAAISR